MRNPANATACAHSVAGGARAQTGAGFTLLEVLVATAIVGTAVAALLGLLSGALGNLQQLEAPEQALLLARSQLNELLAVGAEPNPATGSPLPLDQKIQGRWDQQYRWEARATRFRSSPQRMPGETMLVRIELDVFWRSGSDRRERKLTLETVQLRREPSEVGP